MDKQQTYDFLEASGVEFEITEHKAVYNMEELDAVDLPYPGDDAKNLFVRDDKKRNYYLITVRGDKRINLKDFRIVFYKNSMTVRNRYPNSYWNDIKEKESKSSASYVAKNGNRNSDEYSSNNIFATDNKMKSSYGVLLKPDWSTLEGVSYDGSSDERPEQHKANRIAGYWAASKRKIEASLLATGHNGEVGSISPGYLLSMDGTELYPVSISRDWWDDVVKLVMMEI